MRAKLAVIAAQVQEATARFNANDPATSAPALAKGLDLTRALLAELHSAKLPDEARYNAVFELEIKERQFNTALAQSLGMSMLATVHAAGSTRAPEGGPGGGAQVSSQTAIAGEALGVNVHLADQGTAAVGVRSVATGRCPQQVKTGTSIPRTVRGAPAEHACRRLHHRRIAAGDGVPANVEPTRTLLLSRPSH